jgi:hypothetical protein
MLDGRLIIKKHKKFKDAQAVFGELHTRATINIVAVYDADAIKKKLEHNLCLNMDRSTQAIC